MKYRIAVCIGVIFSIFILVSCSLDIVPKDAQADIYINTNQSEQSPNLKIITIPIGDWNVQRHSNVSVAHGLSDINSIRMVTCIIRNDSGTKIFTMANSFTDNTFYAYCDITLNCIDTIYVNLQRVGAPGRFGNTDFDSTSYNRGWITIWYEE